jgi:hypothetical protein
MASITTPVTVVAQPYDTSGNGGRKLVRLSNGWLVAVVKDTSTTPYTLRLYKSTDNGTTWASLCFIQHAINSLNDSAMVSKDNTIYLLANWGQDKVISYKIDVPTQTNANIATNYVTVDQNQTSLALVGNSLAIAPDGTLHAAWASENSTYPNSFNIRYAKGTIDANGNVSWGAVEQLTTRNQPSCDHINPSIVVKDNVPYVFVESKQLAVSGSNIYSNSGYYSIIVFKRSRDLPATGTTVHPSWSANNVFAVTSGGYPQSNPCPVVDGNGVIHVVWHGKDATDSVVDNIRYSKSTDGGATWSAATKLTSGNTYNQRDASITVDKNNKLYVVFQGRNATYSGADNIKKLEYDGASWSSIVLLTTNSGNSAHSPSTLSNYADFTDPLMIYVDNAISSVKFRGTWTTNQNPSLTLTSPTDNLTLTEGSTYQISGSATDADSGNVVTVKFKIDDGTTYNVTASVSDGTTPLNFSKTLTYLNSRLYDGATPVTPILDDSVTHKLTVWAEDDKGGKSVDAVRNFTVLYNQPPQISGSDQDLGSISAPPSINYTVTDIEHYSFTITEKVGDTIIRSFAGTDGKQETLTIPDDIWITLQPDVTHNLTITATDQYGASSTRTYTFKRTVDGIELETRIPLPADAQPYRMVLTLNAQYPQNAVVNVQVCNNGYDENPTWEDATSAVLNGRPYVFTNTTKTALDWGIRIKISILPGA